MAKISTKEGLITYHYVYRITNLVEHKHYYGCRTSKVEPKNDLGIKYFSSSKDKDFIKDQKGNPVNYKYKIICVFETRKEALELEIKLHAKLDVGINESFYNRSKQTSTGFDTTGISNSGWSHTEEAKEKIKIARAKQVITEEHKRKISESMNGHIFSEERNKKISESKKGFKHTNESKKKMSMNSDNSGKNNPMFGKKHSEKTKDKISQSQLGNTYKKGIKEKTYECPHCGRWCNMGNLKRWHLDNCKIKGEINVTHNN